MAISGLPLHFEVPALCVEGSPIKFPILGFVLFPIFGASWTSPLGLALALKAGVALGICLPLWVPPSLNFGLIILLFCQFFEALKKELVHTL